MRVLPSGAPQPLPEQLTLKASSQSPARPLALPLTLPVLQGFLCSPLPAPLPRWALATLTSFLVLTQANTLLAFIRPPLSSLPSLSQGSQWFPGQRTRPAAAELTTNLNFEAAAHRTGSSAGRLRETSGKVLQPVWPTPVENQACVCQPRPHGFLQGSPTLRYHPRLLTVHCRSPFAELQAQS